jgi:hypothetical protein
MDDENAIENAKIFRQKGLLKMLIKILFFTILT